MVRVNKKYIEQKLQDAAWRRFGETMRKSKSERELLEALREFMTDSEVALLEKRLLIPILLKKGMSYRAIGEAIDVTRTTISFVKHNLTRKPRVHRQYSSSKSYKEKRKLPFLPSRVGHSRWLRAKLSGKKFY